MTDNIEKLAKTLNRRMHTVAGGKVDVTLEIGEMVGSSLKVSVGKIPKGQYSVLSHTIKLTVHPARSVNRKPSPPSRTRLINSIAPSRI